MERERDIPPSVSVELPPDMDGEIRQLAEAEGTSWTLVIHGALWCFRGEHMTTEERRQELVDLIQEADSGSYTEATPEFWKDFKRRARERLERIKRAKKGNLLLPVELHAFIHEQIALGAYQNPTEVVCAALPSLRWRIAAAHHRKRI